LPDNKTEKEVQEYRKSSKIRRKEGKIASKKGKYYIQIW